LSVGSSSSSNGTRSAVLLLRNIFNPYIVSDTKTFCGDIKWHCNRCVYC
jgi:hypothetical protein